MNETELPKKAGKTNEQIINLLFLPLENDNHDDIHITHYISGSDSWDEAESNSESFMKGKGMAAPDIFETPISLPIGKKEEDNLRLAIIASSKSENGSTSSIYLNSLSYLQKGSQNSSTKYRSRSELPGPAVSCHRKSKSTDESRPLYRSKELFSSDRHGRGTRESHPYSVSKTSLRGPLELEIRKPHHRSASESRITIKTIETLQSSSEADTKELGKFRKNGKFLSEFPPAIENPPTPRYDIFF